MKELKCEICDGVELVKMDGFFVCQDCGCKYSVEETKKLLFDIKTNCISQNSCVSETVVDNAKISIAEENSREDEFVFECNEQLKKEFRRVLFSEDITMAEIAKRCGISPQNLNNKFNNSRVALTDLKMFLECFGYVIKIRFEKIRMCESNAIRQNRKEKHL